MYLLYFLIVLSASLCSSQHGASAFASPIPPPLSIPVWSLSAPLSSTTDEDLPTSLRGKSADKHSMNIVTFATAVSVAPPKIWAVSLYTTSLTRRAFLDSKVGVLQLLRPDQSKLVPILGKRSGYEDGYDKRNECKGAGFGWVAYCGGDDESGEDRSKDEGFGLQCLPGCASYIKLKVLSYHNAGDHDVALCEVLDTAVWNETRKAVTTCRLSSQDEDEDGRPVVAASAAIDPTTALYTGQLREEGII